MELLVSFFIFICALVLIIGMFIIYQGNEKVCFLVQDRTTFKLEQLTADKAVFSCLIPFTNRTGQDGTVMDAFPRHLLPQEQFDEVEVKSTLTLADNPREDGYWEALILLGNTSSLAILTVTLTAKNGNISTTIQRMVDMPIEIYYQVVGRTNWHINKDRIVMSYQEIMAALDKGVNVQRQEAI